MNVHYAYRSLIVGGRLCSFTDISVEVAGQWYGSRLHGSLSRQEIGSYAEATARRVTA